MFGSKKRDAAIRAFAEKHTQQMAITRSADHVYASLCAGVRHAMRHVTPDWNGSLDEVASKAATETLYRLLDTVTAEDWERLVIARQEHHVQRSQTPSAINAAVDSLNQSDAYYRRFANYPPQP